MKILHIVTGLSTGGAETMLYKLLTATRRLDSEVLSLIEPAEMGSRIAALGVTVATAGMSRKGFSAAALARLGQHIQRARPDVVQTWMYHADLLGGATARLQSRAPVVWNIRASVLDVDGISRRTRMLVRICARASSVIPSRIICGSEAARQTHAALGYDGRKLLVIPNGFDSTLFRPDAAARTSVRDELGVPRDAPIIGMFGRFDPLKDHATFFAAAAIVHQNAPESHFVMCGEGVSTHNDVLMTLVGERMRSRVHLLGRRSDMPRLAAAADVGCLSSYSEGFPNVVGEFMSCGVPCVVTDVGDASAIVGQTGLVVPSRDPAALAAACLRMLRMEVAERLALGSAARRRIEENFSLSAVALAYERLYRDVAATQR